MSDIELVIRIPEEIRLALINNIQLSLDQQSICDSYIKRAIINGMPLPKEHGNLIDTKEFIKAINDWADNIDNYGAYEELEIAKALLQNHAHTIIEADKETDDYYRGAQEEY